MTPSAAASGSRRRSPFRRQDQEPDRLADHPGRAEHVAGEPADTSVGEDHDDDERDQPRRHGRQTVGAPTGDRHRHRQCDTDQARHHRTG